MSINDLLAIIATGKCTYFGAGVAVPCDGFEYQSEIYNYTVVYEDDGNLINGNISLSLQDVNLIINRIIGA